MKIHAMTMSDPMRSRIEAEGLDVVRTEEAECLMDVVMSRVEIQHMGSAQRFRPYLHLSGEVAAVVPESPLRDGVDRLEFPLGSRPAFDGFYYFDEDQLEDLVSKGYFEEDFRVPKKLENEYELPVTADFVSLPRRAAEDVPVVFVSLQDLDGMHLDAPSTGYDLAAYFEPVAQVREQEVMARQAMAAEGPDLSSPEFSDARISELFPDMPFPDQQQTPTVAEAERRADHEVQAGTAPGAQREPVVLERTAELLVEMDRRIMGEAEDDPEQRMYEAATAELAAERELVVNGAQGGRQGPEQVDERGEQAPVGTEEGLGFTPLGDDELLPEEDEAEGVRPIEVSPEVSHRVHESSMSAWERAQRERERTRAMSLAEQIDQEDQEEGPSLG